MLVAQQTPTAPRPLEEPAGNLTVHYAPEPDGTVEENPPRFVWLPELDAGARYALRLTGGDLAEPLVFTDIPRSFFTPDRVLTPGRYQWSYALWRDGVLTSAWSAERALHARRRTAGDAGVAATTAMAISTCRIRGCG